MAFGNHARDDVGVLLDLFTQQEKSGLGLVFGQHIEKALVPLTLVAPAKIGALMLGAAVVLVQF